MPAKGNMAYTWMGNDGCGNYGLAIVITSNLNFDSHDGRNCSSNGSKYPNYYSILVIFKVKTTRI